MSASFKTISIVVVIVTGLIGDGFGSQVDLKEFRKELKQSVEYQCDMYDESLPRMFSNDVMKAVMDQLKQTIKNAVDKEVNEADPPLSPKNKNKITKIIIQKFFHANEPEIESLIQKEKTYLQESNQEKCDIVIAKYQLKIDEMIAKSG